MSWTVMTLIPASLLILSAAVLVTLGGLAMARKADSRQVPPAGTWPGVALVVPAAGAGAELPEAAAALLSQDYPFYRLIFVTRDGGDPATGIIRKAVGRDPRARHVLSGKALGCGQKNHNLLRGVEAALEENPEILAFCDSTRIAPPHWLRALVAPVAFGEVEVSSGYHHVLPLDGRLPAAGHAFSVLLLYLTKGFSLLNQPWGGGTAIRMETFERLKVTDVWARNIVDDVSLAAILNKARIRVGLSRGAWATTPLRGETMGSWLRWLFRQWFYLKVCLPLSWAAAGVYCHLFSGMLVLALFAAFGGIPGRGAAPAGWTFLALFGALALILRALHPGPGGRILWVGAGFLTIPAASLAHLMTLFSMSVTWRHIRYRVGWGGIVEELDEDG